MTLGSFIATILSGVLVGLALQYLRPKVKIVWWHPHRFLYRIPQRQGQQPPPGNQPATFDLLTHSITIQNIGKKAAESVQIVHQARPDFFKLDPPLNFEEFATPAGEFGITVKSLAPNEFFTIQFLSYTRLPDLLYIRSQDGHAKSLPVRMMRIFPKWLNGAAAVLMLTGTGFVFYWLCRVGLALWELIRPALA